MKDLIIDGILIIFMVIAVMALVGTINLREREMYQYEYETIDGDSGIAVSCGTPYRGVPYCVLDDGTRVYGLKQYKKVSKEEE